MDDMPIGSCYCGCGKKTTISKVSNKQRGTIKGCPVKFANGHNNRIKPIGYKFINDVYAKIKISYNPKPYYIREHILLAEIALGKSLPRGTEVHHYNDNQLVICQDSSYHKLLHKRQRAYEACGHANWRRCWICKQYDDPLNLYINGIRHYYHRKCIAFYNRTLSKNK